MMIINYRKVFLMGFTILLALVLVFTFYTAFTHKLLSPRYYGEVQSIKNMLYLNAEGEKEVIKLPAKLNIAAPRELFTVSSQVEVKPGESIMLKSVFAPMKLYFNNLLVYEYGQEGTYPAYMNDPPTMITTIPFPDVEGLVEVKIEYLAPMERSVMSIPTLYIGGENALLLHQFRENGFSFGFSALLIFIGLLMIVIAFTLVRDLPAGWSFIWLGFFALAAGVWGMGECDLTGLIFPYPTLLYAMAYLGLFTVAIPFLQFGLLVLEPSNKWPLKILLGVHYISLATVLALHLSGTMNFIKSLYWFHIITPLAFVTFALVLISEHFRHHNPAAKRFAPASILLAIFVLMELLNYWVRFTNVLTLFFQLGVLGFVILLGIASGYYIKASLQTRAENIRLAYEMAAVGRQLDLQRIQYQKLAATDDAVKTQRHDLRHQLAVLQELGVKDDKEAFNHYISALIENIPTEREVCLCENYAVNALASHYYSLAQSKGIEVRLKLIIPPKLTANLEVDLCIIIGNLLENGIEANATMPPNAEKFIRMNTTLQHNTLVITMDNSFNQPVRKKDGVFLSSKREGEGIGLSSVKAVAAKYGGNADFTATNQVFQSSVYLNIN